MDSSRTALRLLMAELARARRAMAHGNVDEARLALDAALAIDSRNVQALDWRAELDRGQPPVPQAATRAPVAAASGGWVAFEQRVREKRARKRTEAARAALATGDHATAREALEELVLLAPGHPDVLALQRELARTGVDAIPGPPLGSPKPANQPLPPALKRPDAVTVAPSIPRATAAAPQTPQARPSKPVVMPPAFTVTHPPPSTLSRLVPLSIAAVVLTGIGGVLGFTVVNRARDLTSNPPARVTSDQPTPQMPQPSPPPPETEPVSTAGETVASASARGENLSELQRDRAEDIGVGGQGPGPTQASGDASHDVLAAAPPVTPAAVAESHSFTNESSRPPPSPAPPLQSASSTRPSPPASPAAVIQETRAAQASTRTPLPSREYPGSTMDMSVRTQLDTPAASPAAAAASSRPSSAGSPAGAAAPAPQAPASALPDPAGARAEQPAATRAESNDTNLISSPTGAPAPTDTAVASVSPASNTTLPSRESESRITPQANRVDPVAAAEASVRQLLDRYVRAYNKLDAAAAHAVWPGVDKSALARAFSELSAQTLRFERCAVAVDEEGGTATCSGDARWVPRVGGQGSKREQRTWRFELARNGEDWIITRAEARR